MVCVQFILCYALACSDRCKESVWAISAQKGWQVKDSKKLGSAHCYSARPCHIRRTMHGSWQLFPAGFLTRTLLATNDLASLKISLMLVLMQMAKSDMSEISAHLNLLKYSTVPAPMHASLQSKCSRLAWTSLLAFNMWQRLSSETSAALLTTSPFAD
jgi:hypothetical protein